MSAPTPAVIADRAAGAILASAAGDALGAPHEFGPPLDAAVELRMSGGGSFGWKPGEWTDDTQMALALLTPLARGDRDVAAVEAGFLAWYAAGATDVGHQTRAVLRVGAPLAVAARRHLEQHPDYAAGNGGLMRVGPAGLSFSGEPARIAEYAAATTALTHADPDCIDASVLWAVAIDHTIRNAPLPSELWDFGAAVVAGLGHVPEERRTRWAQLIDQARSEPGASFRNNGWVVAAFQAALAAIVHTPTPDDSAPSRHLVAAIEAAVRFGGDTDTVAAIAGALLGARWGATALPLAWRSVLRGQRINGQPELRASDLETLARRAVAGGAGDRQGWPGVDRLVPYYLDRFGAGPLPQQLFGVRFGGVGGLSAALQSGADVVVSLCRMGTKDVPADVEHQVVGLIDTDAADNPNLAFLLADTADFIATRVAQGRSVYAHCVAADNRAPAVAAAYLARHGAVDPRAAVEQVTAAFGHAPKPFLIEGARQAAAL